jgi:hypothetical protein
MGRRGQRRRGVRSEPAAQGPAAPALDRELQGVSERCNAFKRALETGDAARLEQAGYALAGAWFLAESCAMRMLGQGSGIPARYTRRAITATSTVLTATFGEALAETSRWIAEAPKRPGLMRLRTVLAQLSARVDVRDVDGVYRLRGTP